MEKNINAHCAICGEGYHVCKSCTEQQTFKPWRTVVDSVEHYKIYLALHGYTLSKDKEVAKKELEHCDLSNMENFKPEVKKAIKEIMFEKKRTKTSVKKLEETTVEILSIDNSIESFIEE